MPLIIDILFSALTVWLSAQIVTKRSSIQGALIFSVISYAAFILIGMIPIPSIPFISTYIFIQVLIKTFIAMKFFSTDFSGGLAITGVQMLFGSMLIIPF